MILISIIAASISPQAKAHVASIATGSVGLATFLEAIPSVVGVVASIIGVVYSSILIVNAVRKSKQDSEMHTMKMKLMLKELDEDE